MRGRTLVIWAGAGLAVFGVALWYFQTYAFYAPLAEQPLVIDGTSYPVLSWSGIDAHSSPLKRRVCFSLAPDSARQIIATAAASQGEPLVAPGWFDCFDAKRLSQDVQNGAAVVITLGASNFEGVDDMMALYPDGRGYIWRQLQAAYANQ